MSPSAAPPDSGAADAGTPAGGDGDRAGTGTAEPDTARSASWTVVTALSAAQFVMVLDSSVMNVSISTVVEDLDTTVAAMQATIPFYTLTMAALMLVGAKLGDVWGRLSAFVIGSIVYAVGSQTTALVAIVYGMLQSKIWGWIRPLDAPVINGVAIIPLGISLTTWLILSGCILLAWFFGRQRRLAESGRTPLLDVGLFDIRRLRSGLGALGARYAVTAGLFFMVPVYLQMTLGFDALQTGLRIFPLSISLILFSFAGTRLSNIWSARRIVRVAQGMLAFSALVLLASGDVELQFPAFGIGMFTAGAALGLLASQLAGSVAVSEPPDDVKAQVAEATDEGVELVPASTVAGIGEDAGPSPDDAETLADAYRTAQIGALRVAFVGLIAIALGALLFSKGIPDDAPPRRPRGRAVQAEDRGGTP